MILYLCGRINRARRLNIDDFWTWYDYLRYEMISLLESDHRKEKYSRARIAQVKVKYQ